jgi:threonine dehydrogenase-like Zn-dependent dehydrogenase
MGHELAAEVEEASEHSPFTPGERVFVMPYISCGNCASCARGKTNCCRHLQVLGVHRDGGLAEYLSIPERFVFKGEGLTLDQLSMVEFLSIGAHAVRRAQLLPNQRVLVMGAGPIGIATMLFARLQGALVTVIDTRADRLEFCRTALGFTETELADTQVQAALSDLTNGEMFDTVFDATGNPASMEAGFSYVAHGGTYVFVSIVSANITFSDPEFHRREMTLLGSRNATPEDVAYVMQAMRDELVSTSTLNTHRTELGSIPRVLPIWMSPDAGVVKGIVEC